MRPDRKIIRLQNYDYRQSGAYFVTVCVHQHRCVFGRIEEGRMRLNRFGHVVHEEWIHTAEQRQYLTLDEFVVMPNHFHALLFLTPSIKSQTDEGREFGRPQSQSLGTIIGAFKSAVTRKIGLLRDNETLVWQKRFHEHIIRNDHDLEIHRQYITNNPLKWIDDELNVQSL